MNPCPQSGQSKDLSCCHWNVNSLLAQKIYLKYHNLKHKIPFISIQNLYESLSVSALNLTDLSKCIICKVSLQNCKGYIGVIYRSPSHDTTEFEEFLSNFENILNTTASSNSVFTIILGDFNARSSFWWNNDKTRVEGRCPEALTSLQCSHQLLSEPTHLLPTCASCIYLIFADQSNLVVYSGTYSSVKSKLNIKYPPLYQCLLWDYKKAKS